MSGSEFYFATIFFWPSTVVHLLQWGSCAPSMSLELICAPLQCRCRSAEYLFRLDCWHCWGLQWSLNELACTHSMQICRISFMHGLPTLLRQCILSKSWWGSAMHSIPTEGSTFRFTHLFQFTLAQSWSNLLAQPFQLPVYCRLIKILQVCF